MKHRMRYLNLCVVSLVLLGVPLSASAVSIQLDWQVSAGGPQDPWGGTIVYEAASLTSPIDSLTSIALTVAGHVYTLGEIGHLNVGVGGQQIGGLISGVSSLVDLTDDFHLAFDPGTGAPLAASYRTSTVSGSWSGGAATFTSFSLQQVPEPSTLALLGLGLLGAAVVRRSPST